MTRDVLAQVSAAPGRTAYSIALSLGLVYPGDGRADPRRVFRLLRGLEAQGKVRRLEDGRRTAWYPA